MNKTVVWIGIVVVLVAVGLWFAYANNNSSMPSSGYSDNGTVMPEPAPAPSPVPPTNPAPAPAPAPTPTPPPPSGSVRNFTVTGRSFSFTPATLTVKKGDTVNITFKNVDGLHDLIVDGYNVGTNRINTGEQATISFVATKSGSFEYYCSVGTHRQMGMRGTLTVTP